MKVPLGIGTGNHAERTWYWAFCRRHWGWQSSAPTSRKNDWFEGKTFRPTQSHFMERAAEGTEIFAPFLSFVFLGTVAVCVSGTSLAQQAKEEGNTNNYLTNLK